MYIHKRLCVMTGLLAHLVQKLDVGTVVHHVSTCINPFTSVMHTWSDNVGANSPSRQHLEN